ncbi:hypothetical protein CRENPOLYSF1_50107 [Crenothrix polyspora]|jgi:hypothetical protein|uniref:Uncharacterized protein n=1 Tax=Crenothrix polyspora TaxID=360316 RepID=A0A1R4HDF7_9GAMM|nr:hypothetical protein CRENPOLYSF1_50107 [Crenothrix polyspora]
MINSLDELPICFRDAVHKSIILLGDLQNNSANEAAFSKWAKIIECREQKKIF